MKHSAHPAGVTRQTLIDWYVAGRERTRAIFRLVDPGAYYERPIALRNPIVFYEGHLPAFAINTLVKIGLGRPGIHEDFEVLFARGIDPDSVDAVRDPTDVWPSPEAVAAYGRAADERIVNAFRDGKLEGVAAEAALNILEHEAMHQETLLYMLHNLAFDRKFAAAPLNAADRNGAHRETERGMVHIPKGVATLGGERDAFGWDNEFPAMRVEVEAFEIDRHDVTNGEYLAYMEATGAPAPHFWLRGDGEWYWRGMFSALPLPLDWPVYVMHEEAEGYARWRGARLPSEGEFHRAAFSTPEGEERLYPWGDEPADGTRGNFDFTNWDPVPVGSYPAGASAWGVHDLYGNGWEWTSTVFDGFPGFEPMASYGLYSVDFFDGKHYVLKGASPVTAKELVRRSFRNWFRPSYPYVYATFRCAR